MANHNHKFNFQISTLGTPFINSPISLSSTHGDKIANYVTDDQTIVYDLNPPTKSYPKKNLLELAGPREKIFFKPEEVHAGIITCGGLCPGLNDVIRSIVMCLWHQYGVKKISGIRYGFCGLVPENNYPPIILHPHVVTNIHQTGGTILGASRGSGERKEIIDTIINKHKINMLFVIGGDGSQKAALKIAREAKERGAKLAVIGIPKTIDNDLSFIHKSFGFDTAVSLAVNAISSAHIEAQGAINGIGLVKLMGRESGFIAAHTALALNDVNFVLIPEVSFDLYSKNGFLYHLRKRVKKRHHAVVVVAEGAGQNLLKATKERDPSGNIKFDDIGTYLKKEISNYFKKKKIEINLKYIDPSYMIRSAPANPNDSIYCARLGANAVHAAMAGKTKLLIGLIHDQCVHLPIELAISHRNVIDPESPFWRDVLSATGQPITMAA